MIVSREFVAQVLKEFCAKHDTLTAAAKKLGITLSQLSTALRNKKSAIPAKALKKLGFAYKPVYIDQRKVAKSKSLPAPLPTPVVTTKPTARKPSKRSTTAAGKRVRAAGENPTDRMAGEYPEHPTPRHGRTADDVVREAIESMPADTAEHFGTAAPTGVDPDDMPVAL